MLENDVLADAGHSEWLREALRSALRCDPVRVANDAQLLASVLMQRADRLAVEPEASANPADQRLQSLQNVDGPQELVLVPAI